jgi:hypothetical protein
MQMKKLGLVMFAMLAAAMVARADGSLAVMGSYWSPKDFDSTPGIGGKLLLGAKSFGLELRGSYFESVKESDGIGHADLQIYPLEVGLVLRAADQELVPYIGGGVGYYIINGNQSGADRFQVDDEVGWYATGGLELSLGKSTAIFGEVLYRGVTGTVKEDDIHNVQSEAAIDFSGFVVNAGFAIRF